MSLAHPDDMAVEQILLSRIAILENRLQALSDLVVAASGSGDDDDELATTLVVEPDSQIELANGFHLREWDAQGNPFRWAGRAEYFEFRFFLDRRSARPFRMRGMFAAGVACEDLHGYVDYRQIPLKIERDGDMVDVIGRIPTDRLGQGVTLTFFCPTAAAAGTDSRRLSFAFSRMVVGEAPRRLADAPADLGARDDSLQDLGAFRTRNRA